MTALRQPERSLDQRTAEILSSINTLTQADLSRLHAWESLADLSSETQFEAIDANESSIVFSGDKFEAVADVYVHLNYGSANDEASLSDSYVATVKGRVSPTGVSIDRVKIDTGPFYS